MGDEGLSQCAGKCDSDGTCVGYSMTETGMCTMMKAINVSQAPAAQFVSKEADFCLQQPRSKHCVPIRIVPHPF